jgi:hypothetical protein
LKSNLQISIRRGEVTYWPDRRILRIHVMGNQVMEIADFYELLEAQKQLVRDDHHSSIITFQEDYVKLSKEVRKYQSVEISRLNRVSVALVIKSPAHRFYIGIYLRINKPIIPTKIFKTIDAAQEWSVTRLQKHNMI